MKKLLALTSVLLLVSACSNPLGGSSYGTPSYPDSHSGGSYPHAGHGESYSRSGSYGSDAARHSHIDAEREHLRDEEENEARAHGRSGGSHYDHD